jgi:hypothetical protein
MQREPVDKKKPPPRDASPAVEEEEDGVAGFLPDLLRRGLTLGFTGFFLTEEAVRKALGESVPRDLMDFILNQSERTRAEFLDRVSKEFARAFSVFDPVELARQLLDGQTIEVNARIRLVPSGTDGEEAGAKRTRRAGNRSA